jgi:hypothetical protein
MRQSSFRFNFSVTSGTAAPLLRDQATALPALRADLLLFSFDEDALAGHSSAASISASMSWSGTVAMPSLILWTGSPLGGAVWAVEVRPWGFFDIGKSVAAQEHDIREGAELLGVNVVRVYSEGEAAPSSIDLYARWSSSSVPRHGVRTW